MNSSKREYMQNRIQDAHEAEALWGIKMPAISLDDYDLD